MAAPMVGSFLQKTSRFVAYFRFRRSYADQKAYILKDIFKNYSDIKLAPFQIGSYSLGENFSNAQIEFMQYLENGNGKMVRPLWAPVTQIDSKHIFTHYIDFSSIFEKGFKAIDEFIDVDTTPSTLCSHGQSRLVDDGGYHHQQSAMTSLIDFVNNRAFHENCLKMLHIPADYNTEISNGLTGKINDGDIAVLLTNHIFSKLSTNNLANNCQENNYLITKDIKHKKRHCPCTKQCGAEITYGNFEFGSEYLWFGKTDIMVFPASGGACNIIVPPSREYDFIDNDDEDVAETETENQITDVKSDMFTIRNHDNVKQIVAQTLTFSFLHKKMNEGKLSNTTLIPTIATCNDAFDIYLYDCDNDILLRNMGQPIPLFKYAKLNMSAIVQLWMIINHAVFSQSLDVEALDILRGSCGLSRTIRTLEKERYNYIMKTLGMKRHFREIVEPEFEFVHALRVGSKTTSKQIG